VHSVAATVAGSGSGQIDHVHVDQHHDAEGDVVLTLGSYLLGHRWFLGLRRVKSSSSRPGPPWSERRTPYSQRIEVCGKGPYSRVDVATAEKVTRAVITPQVPLGLSGLRVLALT
jgi:hypothetical protein